MSFTVFLGNLPTWVTADDIMGWLTAENLVADAIKVIRNPETQESKGFAFIESPNTDEMNSIIRRFDRAPLEDRLLRANPAQPPRPKSQGPPFAPGQHSSAQHPPAQQRSHNAPPSTASAGTGSAPAADQRPRRTKRPPSRRPGSDSQSPFAEELAKVL